MEFNRRERRGTQGVDFEINRTSGAVATPTMREHTERRSAPL